LQNFAIAPVWSLLGTRLEVAIKLEDRSVVSILAMGGEDTMHAAQNSFLPVDEGAVAIESENFKSAEVEHGRFISGMNSKA
jgi:hypothetical protein